MAALLQLFLCDTIVQDVSGDIRDTGVIPSERELRARICTGSDLFYTGHDKDRYAKLFCRFAHETDIIVKLADRRVPAYHVLATVEAEWMSLTNKIILETNPVFLPSTYEPFHDGEHEVVRIILQDVPEELERMEKNGDLKKAPKNRDSCG